MAKEKTSKIIFVLGGLPLPPPPTMATKLNQYNHSKSKT